MAVLPITGVGGAAPAAPATTPTDRATGGKGGGFGQLVADAMNKLDATQAQAAQSSEAIATGKSTDISKVAMDVEAASLSLQLAVQVRNKLVDAYNEMFRMQI